VNLHGSARLLAICFGLFWLAWALYLHCKVAVLLAGSEFHLSSCLVRSVAFVCLVACLFLVFSWEPVPGNILVWVPVAL
jgi:hypothetical protein